MKDPNVVFAEIKEMKSQLKELRKICRDVLENAQEYQEVKEKMDTLKEKQKHVKAAAQQQCGQELGKIDELKEDIASHEQLLTDISITKFMNGETIAITDRDDQEYEPVFKVTFKKVN